jgi:hypothetical protein
MSQTAAAPAALCPAIVFDHLGRFHVEIPGSTGEVVAYYAQRADAGADMFAALIGRLDQTGDGPYRIGLSRAGWWRCAAVRTGEPCKSYRFRKGPYAPRGCRHIAAVKNLYLLLRSFGLQPQGGPTG